MAQGKVPCKQCGGDAEIEKECGDNGSSFNGVAFRLECSKCGYHSHEDFIRSQHLAIEAWESDNLKTITK